MVQSSPTQDPLQELEESQQPWWRHYSTHGEFPWSSLSSLGLHLLVILLVIAAATPFIRPDPTPPAVDVVYIGEDEDAAPGDSEEPPGDVMEPTSQDVPEDAPREQQVTEVQEVTEPEPTEPEDLVDEGVQRQKDEEALDNVRDRLKRAQAALAQNFADKNESGSPGGGGGGSGPTGRAARPARWVLRFNTNSPKDYLRQLDGLKAAIAFPQDAGLWLYIYNPSSPNPRREKRTLENENRLYWVDNKADSVAGVARALGVGPTPVMAAFLPLELEERMLKLELAYNNLEEDEIASTKFECVVRGGKYDVVVVHQIPK